MHRLQDLFATAEGEHGFNEQLQALFETTGFDAAEALLAAELATMDTEIARLCRELSRGAVVLTGWEHLVEAIELHEGAPVTGVTLAIANALDLTFAEGKLHEPYVTIGLHTDEAYAFSAATPADMIAECKAPEGAAWAGREEDVELYLEATGFGPLNTALLVHQERHFFRDGSAAEAPIAYVDYVIGCWWRALRFQQAVAAEYARLGLPGAIPVVAGMVDMRPELASVHLSDAPVADAPLSDAPPSDAPAAAAELRAEPVEMGEISAADFIQRRPPEEEEEPTGTSLRRRFAGSEPEEEPVPEKTSLFRRLFRRTPPLDDAA